MLEDRVGEILRAEQEATTARHDLGQILSALNAELSRDSIVNTDVQARQRRDSRSAEIRYQDKNIFLVDDEPHMRRLLRHVAEELGFGDAIEFADGEETLEHISKHGLPDVMVCDIEMLPIDGFELVARSAALLGLPSEEVPVVFLTRHAEIDVARPAKELGARAFVVKPPSIGAIKDRIDHVLARNETHL